ncbi:unnamed protein product, partial [Staurois parvus]
VKKFNTPAVCERDLKVAHGRVWRWRQQQWEAVQGPMRDSWTWQQQHEEAVYRGPWQIRGLAAAMGGP